MDYIPRLNKTFKITNEIKEKIKASYTVSSMALHAGAAGFTAYQAGSHGIQDIDDVHTHGYASSYATPA